MDNWTILDVLVGIILRHVKGCVVEIGCGVSTHILARHAREADVTFYTCDIVPKKANIVSGYKKNKPFPMTSLEFMKRFKDSPAVVLIDGQHDFGVVSREFNFFFDRLVDGGVIFLHDTYPPDEKHVEYGSCGDVYRLRRRLERKTDKMDCFTWPYTAGSCGLTMVIKKPKNRPYYQQ